MQVTDEQDAKLVADGHVVGVRLSQCPGCQKIGVESYLSSRKETKTHGLESLPDEYGEELAGKILMWLGCLLLGAALGSLLAWYTYAPVVHFFFK